MISDAQGISPILSALEETKKLFIWANGARTTLQVADYSSVKS